MAYASNVLAVEADANRLLVRISGPVKRLRESG